MKMFTKIIVGMGLIVAMGLSFNTVALADCNNPSSPAEQAKCGVTDADTGNTTETSLSDTIKTIINILLFAVGIIAVIMIIWGGISYSISAGDQGKAKNARNTIVYSVVGLVIAIAAFAIVQFVFSNLSGSSSGSGSGSKCASGQSWNASTEQCE